MNAPTIDGESWNTTWNDDATRVWSTFKLRTSQEDPSPTGILTWYGRLENGAVRIAPLVVTNSASLSAVTGGIYSSNEGLLRPMNLESFTLEFYQDGVLRYSRDGFSMTPGWFALSGIPAGTYRIRCVPNTMLTSPQWYPNASDYAGAADVTLSAGQTLDGLYFVFGPIVDVNGDGATDISDVVTITLMSLGVEPTDLSGDLNGDQTVDIRDVILALRRLLGLP